MSKILFTHSYFYRFDPKQWKAKQPYPPFGTLYGAAYLRTKGYGVSLFDTNLKKSPDEIVPVLKEEKPKYLVIFDDGFNYLTKMCLTNMREAAFRLTELGKDAGCTVIVSSSDSTDHYDMYLSKGANYVILGEAEITLGELINNLEEENSELQNVQGLVYISNIEDTEFALTAHPLFKELGERFAGKTTELNVSSFLQKKGFKPVASKNAAKSYIESVKFVDEETKGYNLGESTEEEPQAMAQNAQAGRAAVNAPLSQGIDNNDVYQESPIVISGVSDWPMIRLPKKFSSKNWDDMIAILDAMKNGFITQDTNNITQNDQPEDKEIDKETH